MSKKEEPKNKGQAGDWSEKAARYLRQNVLGLVAIFIALGGTSVARKKDGWRQ